MQHDNVMWGDRKLNVAPAVKKNSTSPIVSVKFYIAKLVVSDFCCITKQPTAGTLYQGSRITSTSFYTNPGQMPTTLYSNPAVGVSTPELSQQPPAVDPVSVDVTSNGLYQTAVICRLPHQYAVVRIAFMS